MSERETAIEMSLHRIAANIHALMAAERVTVEELRMRLYGVDQGGVVTHLDSLLSANRDAAQATPGDLAVIAFVMGAEWDFQIKRRPPSEPPV